MTDCYHKEVDTRICINLKNASAKKFYVRTIDTDVIVVVFGIFKLQKIYSDIDIWVAFNMGKHFHINSI